MFGITFRRFPLRQFFYRIYCIVQLLHLILTLILFVLIKGCYTPIEFLIFF